MACLWCICVFCLTVFTVCLHLAFKELVEVVVVNAPSSCSGCDTCSFFLSAALGPPSQVAVSPAGSVLDISISDPLTSSNSSMRDITPDLYYRIIYWEGPAHLQVGLKIVQPPLSSFSPTVAPAEAEAGRVIVSLAHCWLWRASSCSVLVLD